MPPSIGQVLSGRVSPESKQRFEPVHQGHFVSYGWHFPSTYRLTGFWFYFAKAFVRSLALTVTIGKPGQEPLRKAPLELAVDARGRIKVTSAFWFPSGYGLDGSVHAIRF